MKRCSSSVLSPQVMYDIPIVETCEIKDLPPEVLDLIFRYLDWSGIQRAQLVNKNWGEKTTDIVCEESQKTINFLTLLNENLSEEHVREKRQLDSVIVKLFTKIKIKEVQIALDGIEEKVLKILKNIKRINQDSLERISIDEVRPRGFENLFKLVSLYRDLDESYRMSNRLYQICWKGQISFQLARYGRFDKSLRVIKSTRNYLESSCLISFHQSMIEQGFIPKLLSAADKLRPDKKYRAMLRISQILLIRGDYGGCLEIIKDIPNKSICMEQLNQLLMLFMRDNNIVKAQAVTDLLNAV